MLFQFLPRLSDDEYAALEKSILEHGIQVPILVDENKSIIDGHHRKEIADRHDLDCPRRFAMDLDETQKRTLALSLNLDRRHLSREQKRELVEKSLKADPRLSNRQHANRTGVDHKTIKARRDDLLGRGEIPHVDQHTDSLGRQQPARVAPFVNTETGEVSDDYVTDQADLDAPFVDASDDQIEQAFAAAREQSDVSHRNVVGNLPDGKTYTRPEPTKPRRTPLPDSIRNAVLGAETKLTTLRDLTRDDRWPRNAEEVAPRLRNDLMRLKDLLAQVEKSLPENEVTA